jgi:hypothetical protein
MISAIQKKLSLRSMPSGPRSGPVAAKLMTTLFYAGKRSVLNIRDSRPVT